MKIIAGTAAVTALLVSGMLSAAPNYNYVELDYLDIDIDPFEGDGWALGGSALIHPNVYLLGRYSDADTDATLLGTSIDAELQQVSLGVGAQSPLQNDNLSAFGQLTYENVEVDYSDSRIRDEDDSGFGVEGGLRFDVIPQIEINGSVRYIDVGDFYDGEFGYKVGALWNALPWLAVSLDYDETEADGTDVEQLQLGARVYWDRLQP